MTHCIQLSECDFGRCDHSVDRLTGQLLHGCNGYVVVAVVDVDGVLSVNLPNLCASHLAC